MEFTQEELQIVLQALNVSTVQGENARVVADLIEKVEEHLSEEAE